MQQNKRVFLRLHVVFVGLLAAVTVLFATPVEAAKNIILMIADGAGYNTWIAAGMYQGKLGRQVFDGNEWQKLSCTTYPLNLSHKPTGDLRQAPSLVYDPAKAWDATPTNIFTSRFAGYAFLKSTATDSAAAATALATGRKTYNNAINWSSDNRPLRGATIAEIAKTQGKSVGVVTSVPWSHATPAGLGGAHNSSRDNYAEIAREMLDAAWLDVIMGAGHPDFDDDGRPLPEDKKRDFKYVGGEAAWRSLKAGETPWRLVETKAEFEAMISGPTPPKVLATAQAAATLQQKRGSRLARFLTGKEETRKPFATPINNGVPSLATMAEAAVNCLDDNPRGFFLMIEGGAVDWANHANEPDRMIEEQLDFLAAVESVVRWVDRHGNWEDTLLILTADHDCGLIWGPNSHDVAFQPVEDRGAGKMPGMKHSAHGHANSLVPLYARGVGSGRFAELVRGQDPKAAQLWRISGKYLDNTDVFRVMQIEVTNAAKESPPAKR